EHYIPVRTAPTRDQQKQFELLPYKFVEPGFLIIQPEGKVTSRVDRITTMPPEWFRNLLTRTLAQPIQAAAKTPTLVNAWEQFAARQYTDALATLDQPVSNPTKTDQCEMQLLRGMANFRLGRHATAQSIWEATGESFPNHQLGWKAAAEAQGIGPFNRGFEVFTPLSEKAMLAGVESVGSAAPSATFEESELWTRGVEFLLGMQGEDGGFTDCDYDFGGIDSMPNVHVAVTSLAAMALVQASQRQSLPESTRMRAKQAVEKAIAYCMNEANIAKADRDEILWAYAYRLRLVSRCLQLPEDSFDIDRESLLESHKTAVTALENVQSRGGGWYHEYNNPFVTATALVALHEAKMAGAEVDATKIDKGLKSLLSDRFANGAYPYSSNRRPKATPNEGTARDVAASAGRMPLCELSLFHWGKSNADNLASAVERSLAFQENLDVAYKYDNHTSTLAYGGFFFWYDMRARSESINAVGDEAKLAKFKSQHKTLLLALPEIDGCFVDSHELGRVYGTAMGLLSLSNCE
ncbi:MAG: hypothetical protein ACI814_005242, partial [Mariniblastus sp.]